MEPSTETTTFQAVSDQQKPIREWYGLTQNPTTGNARYLNENTVHVIGDALSGTNPNADDFFILIMYSLRHPEMTLDQMQHFDSKQSVSEGKSEATPAPLFDRSDIDIAHLNRLASDLKSLSEYPPARKNANALLAYIAYLLQDTEATYRYGNMCSADTTGSTLMKFAALRLA